MEYKILYKYYNFKETYDKDCQRANYTKDSFDNGYMWASHPSAFNDPYDCALHKIPNLPSDKKTKKYIEVEQFIDKKAVICFCENNDNMLMWSHYADYHKGICIGYDSSIFQKAFTGDEFNLQRYQNISYTHSVNINIDEFDGQQLWCEINKLMSTKSIDWAYEKEWRVILEYDEAIDKTEKGRKLNIDLDSIIKEIIFGVHCEQETKDYFFEKFKDKRFFEARLQNGGFGLDIKAVDHNNIISH
ncbi:MAG: DUF2971 domain-containing protein [Thiovulaceae bacterium]|nr:DUF2971 domain-containing protein [Sulfurimonadaceae bacterium]